MRKDQLEMRIESANAINVTKVSGLKTAVLHKHLDNLKGRCAYEHAPSWCMALLELELKNQDDVETSMEMVMPSLGEPASFDPRKPKLEGVNIPHEEQVLAARDHFLNYTLLPLVKAGDKRMDDIHTLRSIIATLEKNIPKHKGASPELKDFLRGAKVACVALATLGDHSPNAIANVDVDKKHMRQMLLGEFSTDWAPFSAALGGNEFWQEQKSQWRQRAHGDMECGEAISVMEKKFNGPDAHAHIDDCLQVLPTWFRACRAGTTGGVASSLLKTLETRIVGAQKAIGSTSAWSLADVRSLDEQVRKLDATTKKGPTSLRAELEESIKKMGLLAIACRHRPE